MTTAPLPGFENGDNAAGVMPRKKDTRWRIQHRFWLDAHSLRDIPIGEYLADMKKARRLTETIRDGVRLIRDLRAGNITVLCELFPWIRDAFQPETPGDAMETLLQKIAADTEALVANGNVRDKTKGNNVTVRSNYQRGNTSEYAYNKLRDEAYNEDDDDTLLLAIRPDADAGKQAAANFVASVQALAHTTPT